MRLRVHDRRLRDGTLELRPLTEDDWDALMEWNRDAEVLLYSEGDDVAERTLEEVRAIFRAVSRRAFTFLVLLDGRPIGDAWLQEMNLERVRRRFDPAADLRRIDLTIGVKELWGLGLGTRVIGMLTRMGFEEGADALFGCDIGVANSRSRRAFEKNGYRLLQTAVVRGKTVFDLALPRAREGGVRGRDQRR